MVTASKRPLSAVVTTKVAMEPARLRALVEVVIKRNFDLCAQAFAEKPSTEHWSALSDAMWARQAITSSATMDAALPKLEATGVGHWVSTLRNIHESQS